MASRRTIRMVAVASLAAGALVATSLPARGAFHEMKVVEVFAGSAADPSADFVELQMYSAGQNLVGSHLLHVYTAPVYPGDSWARTDCTIPANVVNGANQARIVFSSSQAQTMFGTADFTMPAVLSGEGGAVCFENIDCVSWGSFTGNTTSPAGAPEAAIPAGLSIHRDLKGNSTLENTDDTDNSAGDFNPGAPTPTSNGPANLGALSCGAGGGAGAGGGTFQAQNLRARVKGGRAIITGKIAPPAPGRTMVLTLYANGSPMRKVARKSDELNAESEFKKRFRVPASATRCRVDVAYSGTIVGKKRFRC
jgi:hypothetical protein